MEEEERDGRNNPKIPNMSIKEGEGRRERGRGKAEL